MNLEFDIDMHGHLNKKTSHGIKEKTKGTSKKYSTHLHNTSIGHDVPLVIQ